MAFFAQNTADNLNITRGTKGDTPRRVSWIAAAEVYEKATGRNAYYSMSSQQEIDGPFTRYLMAFCRFCFPANRHEVESVEAFCKELVHILRGEDGLLMLNGEESLLEMMLLACRCLANLMEALPGSAHSVVSNGAVPVLCSKLLEIQFIELAEQTLSVRLICLL